MCHSNRGSVIDLQYFLNCIGTVLPTTGVVVNVAVAVKAGLGVIVMVGDGRLVGVAEGVLVIAACVAVAVSITGWGIFNIDAAIGGDAGVSWTTLASFLVVSDTGRLMGFHLVPPEVT